MRRSILAIALALIATSCATAPANPRLPLPDRPVRPHVAAHELGCLSDAVYERLRRRELIDDAYIEQLRAIIRATHDRRP